MVVAAGGDEQGTRISADDHVEAEDAVVERLDLCQLRDLEVDVSDHVPAGASAGSSDPSPGARRSTVQVERQRRHLDRSVALRPLLARTVTVDLDAVAVRVD